MRLERNFFLRPTEIVARNLLGQTLCYQMPSGTLFKGLIKEVEAYLGAKDKACHTYAGHRSPRVESMYLNGGHLYVYFVYGMYFCLNITTRSSRHPEAILIRALEPLTGNYRTHGPGLICKSLGIDKSLDGVDLCARQSPLWIEKSHKPKKTDIVATPRIGIRSAEEAKDWPLRFILK